MPSHCQPTRLAEAEYVQNFGVLPCQVVIREEGLHDLLWLSLEPLHTNQTAERTTCKAVGGWQVESAARTSGTRRT